MAWTLLTTGLWVPDRKYNRSYLHNILQRHRYMVTTVMNAPPIVPTIDNWWLVALTFYVIQANLTPPNPKSGMSWSTNRARISKLISNNMCVIYTPPVITNCFPGVIMKYFNSSLGAPRSPYQSQSSNNFQENVPLCLWLSYYLKPIYKHAWINDSINQTAKLTAIAASNYYGWL